MRWLPPPLRQSWSRHARPALGATARRPQPLIRAMFFPREMRGERVITVKPCSCAYGVPCSKRMSKRIMQRMPRSPCPGRANQLSAS